MTMVKKTALLIAAGFSLLVASPPQYLWAAGLSSAWVMDKYTKSRLFVGDYDAQNKILHLGWQLSLKGGWKTYWRTPGDAGLPPRWHWKEAKNISGIAVNWPLPELLHIFDMDTYIYHDQVILPIEVKIKDTDQPTSVVLDLDYMICSDICIPQQGKYQISLPAAGKMQISLFQKAQLDRARAKVPPKIIAENVIVAKRGERLEIILPATLSDTDRIIVEGMDGDLLGQAARTKDGLYMIPYQGADGLKLTLTLLRKDGAAGEMTVTMQPKNK